MAGCLSKQRLACIIRPLVRSSPANPVFSLFLALKKGLTGFFCEKRPKFGIIQDCNVLLYTGGEGV
jgi:hypothetical protein